MSKSLHMGALPLVLVAAAGCIQTEGFRCNDSSVCLDGDRQGVCEPEGYCSFAKAECPSGRAFGPLAADPWSGRCVEMPGQDGAASDAPQEIPTTDVPPMCGDGWVDATERCDDGNRVDDDACSNACEPAACGDGKVQMGEGCDDGNKVDSDGCTNQCRPASCGDGVVQMGEQCDDGNAVATDACTNGCLNARCGDGLVRAGVEACDDGNAIQTDACLSTCVLPRCGDGFVRAATEACDDGNTVDSDGCRNNCTLPTCGDGVTQAGEQCDDGNKIETDGCLSACLTATCGDGFVRAGVEACDDGNRVDIDGCTNTCAVARCGDGIVRAGVEACDDGNTSNGDGCTNTCAVARCGDGFVRAGVEACDDGNTSDSDGCTNTCAVARCGDGIVRVGVEACDDGNTSNGDRCTAACQPARCGDGYLWSGVEECDDGNTSNSDTCTSLCLSCSGSSRYPGSNGHCYERFYGPIDWNAAELACRSSGSYLASYETRSESREVWNELLITETNGRFWIGLNDLARDGSFVWSSGVPLDWAEADFESDQPNGGTVQNCVRQSWNAPGWNDYECPNDQPYVCEDEGAFIRSTDNHAYKVIYREVSWDSARLSCAQAGGHLAVIGSSSEQTFVASLVRKNAWLGASDGAVEGTYVWVTGEPFTYTNWNLFEPDSTSDCISMDPSSKRWNAVSCTSPRGFVCEFE